MFDRDALAALSAVLTTGSFEQAAAKLNISQPAISQRIRTFEEQVGTALIRRTRPATATEAGQHLLSHAETLAMMEQHTARALDLTVPDTSLRIAVTADSLATWVPAALAEVKGVLFDLVIDDQDHSADLLRAGEVAGAITVTEHPIAGCDAVALGALDYVAFCAPHFAARHFADGCTASSLRTAPAITYNRKDRLQLAWAEAHSGTRLRVLPTHYVGSTHGITDAAIAGLGWAVNPAPLIRPHFESGALVQLGPETALTTQLIWQVPRRNAAALAPITSALQHHAQS